MPTNGLPTHLAVFAKYWELGQAKTRLGRTIGHLRACDLQREFLGTILRRFSGAAQRQTVVYWPPERHADFRSAAPLGWDLCPQISGNLGEKMSHFLHEQFAATRQRIVLIGADSPDLPTAHIPQAFDLLESVPVVVGPAQDGGYYLLGMNRWVSVFEGITWSSRDVLRNTLANVARQDLEYRLLDVWDDIDTQADLDRLGSRLRESPSDPELAALAGRIQRIMARREP